MRSSVFSSLLVLSVSLGRADFLSSLTEADREFESNNYSSAVAIYDSLLISSEDSSDVLWRLARVYVCMGDIAPRDQKQHLYRRAGAFAERAITADSTKPEGHTWRAAALGNIAMFEGAKTKVQLCTVIKSELDEAIKLNPKDDIAYSILGSFYMALGNISWVERQLAAIFLGGIPDGEYVEAEESLKRAISLSPTTIRHHFELGRLYSYEDRNEEAIEEFRKAASLPALLIRDVRTQRFATERIKRLREE